jgi:hypothetical protein
VSLTSSGFAPATVRPGISLVAVCDMTHAKMGLDAANLAMACLPPEMSGYRVSHRGP